jgi:flagellar basal body-associated protein FliL
MKSFGKSNINKLLFAILACLLAIIAVGTWAAFFSRKILPAENNLEAAPLPQNVVQQVLPTASAIKTFTGIGRLRASLKPQIQTKAGAESTPATVVIEPCFSYNSNDRAFSEELATHIRDFRAATLDYYAALPASSPVLNNDDAMKTELLKRYNSVLHLGKITELYFTNFMIID